MQMEHDWLQDFEKYLGSDKRLAQSSIINYLRYIRYYSDIADTTNPDFEVQKFFTVSSIEAYYKAKPGNVASAVQGAFADYLFKKGKINKQELVLTRDRILELKRSSEVAREIDILSDEETKLHT